MNTSEVYLKSLTIRDNLKIVADIQGNQIDITLQPIKPYLVSDKVSLIIIGQDPTIKNIKVRDKITHTLNLDKKGALRNYISEICKGLELNLENVYATNVFKYFYTIPPAQTIHVLKAHLQPNLELLKSQIALYPEAKIIT